MLFIGARYRGLEGFDYKSKEWPTNGVIQWNINRLTLKENSKEIHQDWTLYWPLLLTQRLIERQSNVQVKYRIATNELPKRQDDFLFKFNKFYCCCKMILFKFNKFYCCCKYIRNDLRITVLLYAMLCLDVYQIKMECMTTSSRIGNWIWHLTKRWSTKQVLWIV